MEDRKNDNENRIVIPVDVTDWAEEHSDAEADIGTLEKAIRFQMETGAKPIAMGRLLIIDRLKALNEEDVLTRSDKILLGFGAAVEYSGKVAGQRHKVTLANGRSVTMRAYMGQAAEEGEKADDDGRLVSSQSRVAQRRAESYLKRVAPGHVYSRLAIVAANRGDVAAAAAALKEKIDEMVAELSMDNG